MPSVILAALLAAAPPSPAAIATARFLTARSIREYNGGEFELALKDATEAYELSGVSALLFNLGQCQRALGNWTRAEFFFRRYLGENPRAKNRAQVLALIAEVRAKAKAAAAATATDVHVREARAASASRGSRPAARYRGARDAERAPQPRRDRDTRDAKRARETPHAPAHVSSTPPLAAPLAATAALPSVTKAPAPYHTHPWLAYTGAALLAGAGVAAYYGGYGYSGAATATGYRNAAPAADAAFYGPSIGRLQGMGTGGLVTAIALGAAGTTLLVLGLIHHH